jgi:signal transduction histidine kinase
MNKKLIRILIVEDSPADAGILRRILARTQQQEWQITQVTRLSQAIEACQLSSNSGDASIQSQEIFDVVLLDLRLPDSTGLETVREFRNAQANIPVVVLTGMNDEELGLQAMAEGAQDYLVKDAITMQTLVRAIYYAIERGQILKQLRESEQRTREFLIKEQELNELKSNFIAMVSHEFRTPMSTIMTSVDLLRYSQDQITPERREKYFERMEGAIKQMVQLLDEVLFLSRDEAGRVEFNPVSLNLVYFCQEITELIQFSIGQEHIIKFSASGDCSQVQVDEELLSCIFTNLLSNAVKYSPKQSEISWNLTCLDNIAIFQVKDRGMGIPEQDKQHLFEAFYRASNSRQIQGTGLGLAIVKRCVDIHQGEIEIESQEGVGTTVTVKLSIKF